MHDMRDDLSSNPSLEDILEKSASLMAHRGYHGTSMRDLAETTGRSLSGLYHYFRGKEDLLYLVNLRGFAALQAKFQDLRGADLGPAETLQALIRNHIVYFTEHLSEMRVLMFGTLELSAGRRREINALKERYRLSVQEIVEAYIAETGKQKLGEMELARKTYLLFGMMNWIFGWYSSGVHGSPDDLAEDIYRTFTEGC